MYIFIDISLVEPLGISSAIPILSTSTLVIPLRFDQAISSIFLCSSAFSLGIISTMPNEIYLAVSLEIPLAILL